MTRTQRNKDERKNKPEQRRKDTRTSAKINRENDLGGFRAYGPALQARGERGFGYDLFTKYNTTEPILESLYAEELNPEKREAWHIQTTNARTNLCICP